jgi:fatty acid desaturase
MKTKSLNHSQARRLVSLGREAQITAMHRLDDRRRVVDLLAYPGLWLCGALISCLAWREIQGPWRLITCALGWLLSGVAINAHILLVHEGMHGVLLKGKFISRLAAAAFGYSVLMSYSAYKVQHLRHHAFLGKAGDPDEYGNYAKSGWRLWALHCLRVGLGSFLYIFLIPALSYGKARGDERIQMLQEYAGLSLLLGLCVWALPAWLLLQAWGLPLLVVNFMLNTRGLTQHSLAEPEDAFLASRSIRSGALVRFCLLQENYHLAHHLYPRVPSYRMHALNELLKDRYPREVTGPGFMWFLGRFFLALGRGDLRPIGVVEHM